MDEQKRHRSIFWPLLFVTIGILLLLGNLGYITARGWEVISQYWPVLLIVGALDGIYRGDGFAGPIVSFGLGVFFLLANLGYLPWNSWELILRFWPVILVAFGLDLIIGRRSVRRWIWGGLLALLLLGGVAWFTVAAPLGSHRSQVQSFSQPLEGATRAAVEISRGIGSLSVSAGAPSGLLAQGSLRLETGETYRQDYSVSGGEGHFSLKNDETRFSPALSYGSESVWNILLNGTLPLDLRISQGVGEMTLNLDPLKTSQVTGKMGVGRTVLRLPASGSLQVDLDNAIGETTLWVPHSAAVEISSHTGIGSTLVPPDFRRQDGLFLSPAAAGASSRIRINASQAIGAVRVEYLP